MACRLHFNHSTPLLLEQMPPLFSFWFDLKNLEIEELPQVIERIAAGEQTALNNFLPFFRNYPEWFAFFYLKLQNSSFLPDQKFIQVRTALLSKEIHQALIGNLMEVSNESQANFILETLRLCLPAVTYQKVLLDFFEKNPLSNFQVLMMVTDIIKTDLFFYEQPQIFLQTVVDKVLARSDNPQLLFLVNGLLEIAAAHDYILSLPYEMIAAAPKEEQFQLLTYCSNPKAETFLRGFYDKIMNEERMPFADNQKGLTAFLELLRRGHYSPQDKLLHIWAAVIYQVEAGQLERWQFIQDWFAESKNKDSLQKIIERISRLETIDKDSARILFFLFQKVKLDNFQLKAIRQTIGRVVNKEAVIPLKLLINYQEEKNGQTNLSYPDLYQQVLHDTEDTTLCSKSFVRALLENPVGTAELQRFLGGFLADTKKINLWGGSSDYEQRMVINNYTQIALKGGETTANYFFDSIAHINGNLLNRVKKELKNTLEQDLTLSQQVRHHALQKITQLDDVSSPHFLHWLTVIKHTAPAPLTEEEETLALAFLEQLPWQKSESQITTWLDWLGQVGRQKTKEYLRQAVKDKSDTLGYNYYKDFILHAKFFYCPPPER